MTEHVVLKMPNLFAKDQPQVAHNEAVPISVAKAPGDFISGKGERSQNSSGDAADPNAVAAREPEHPIPKANFTPMQQARIKQFLQQYAIAQHLQAKNVPGLVQIRELN